MALSSSTYFAFFQQISTDKAYYEKKITSKSSAKHLELKWALIGELMSTLMREWGRGQGWCKLLSSHFIHRP